MEAAKIAVELPSAALERVLRARSGPSQGPIWAGGPICTTAIKSVIAACGGSSTTQEVLDGGGCGCSARSELEERWDLVVQVVVVP